MARGVLVIDENVQILESALRLRNLRIVRIPPGTPDEIIKEHFLPGRIIVTRNVQDFIQDASSFEYGIVDLSHLRFINPSPLSANTTARLISLALMKHSAFSIGVGFILTIHDDGLSTLQPLA